MFRQRQTFADNKNGFVAKRVWERESSEQNFMFHVAALTKSAETESLLLNLMSAALGFMTLWVCFPSLCLLFQSSSSSSPFRFFRHWSFLAMKPLRSAHLHFGDGGAAIKLNPDARCKRSFNGRFMLIATETLIRLKLISVLKQQTTSDSNKRSDWWSQLRNSSVNFKLETKHKALFAEPLKFYAFMIPIPPSVLSRLDTFHCGELVSRLVWRTRTSLKSWNLWREINFNFHHKTDQLERLSLPVKTVLVINRALTLAPLSVAALSNDEEFHFINSG